MTELPRLPRRPNNSFKPNLLRYTKAMAEKACHGVGSTTQVGLTQALDVATGRSAAVVFCAAHRARWPVVSRRFLRRRSSAKLRPCPVGHLAGHGSAPALGASVWFVVAAVAPGNEIRQALRLRKSIRSRLLVRSHCSGVLSLLQSRAGEHAGSNT